MIIKKSVWDSIQSLANKLPMIHIDTIYEVKRDTVYITHSNPVPIIVNDSIKKYSDSIVNKEINVWGNVFVKGELLDWKWKYIPITTQITKTIIEYVPKIVNNPIPVYYNSFYLYGIIGISDNFATGFGLNYITKKGYEYGYFYERVNTQNVHNIKLGIRLFNLK
ncbi:MAG: hypothetical protein WC554_07775 [Clostridia bacterium]